MCQNPHNAVIHLGHQNGTVTLWTPNLPHPAVRLLAHLGPVSSVSVDPSTGGRYMATAGQDGTVKVWDCRNWKGAVRTWNARGGSAILDWSQKGALGVATGGSVNVRVVVSRFLRTAFIYSPLTGLHEAVDPDTICRSRSSTALPHPPRSAPPSHFSPFLPLPRYPHHRPLCRRVRHSRPRLRRAQFRQLRSRPLREQESPARARGQRPAR